MAKIAIDPGHAPGNKNRGPTGYYEFEGMWELSNRLKTALERWGCEVTLTRTKDSNPTLSARGKKAKGCDLFISQHSNAGGGKARGCEVFYSVRIAADKAFAGDLARAASNAMGNANRGAKVRSSTVKKGYDWFSVMYAAVKTGCPHVFICESGFHDNEEDEAILKLGDRLNEIAEAQARVICEYLDVKQDKGSDDVPEQAKPSFKVGDRVRLKPSAITYANGKTKIPSFVKKWNLFVRQVGKNKILISPFKSGPITGWVSTNDLTKI